MIECKLLFNTNSYKFRPHACQALSGFLELEKQKVIFLRIDFKKDIRIPFVNAFCCEINKRKVIYDIEDGNDNLLPSAIDFIHREKILLFKRAYDEQAFGNDELIRPYGLNYMKSFNGFIEKAAFHLAERGFFPPISFPFQLSKIQDWSFINNCSNHTNRIMFCTRLWDQNQTKSRVDKLNETRIQVVSTLRKAFPGNVIAGVIDSPISRKLCRDLILPPKITKRNHYLELIGKSSVCVTTTGLHHSIGWKFGEYVASGKAIVSEPLHFSVPGPFCEGKNYLTFLSKDELIEKCDDLLSHPEKRQEIEYNNINYFIHYLRPDMLIWNTIRQVVDDDVVLR